MVSRRHVIRAGSVAGAAVLVPATVLAQSGGAVPANPEALVQQEPLDPLAIPKYAHDLTVPRVLAPTVVRNSSGRVIRHDYAMSQNVIRAQMLPPGFPQTTQWAFGGRCRIPGSSATEFVASSPGPTFENTRGIPAQVTWRNQITRPHIFAVDPTIHTANPNATAT